MLPKRRHPVPVPLEQPRVKLRQPVTYARELHDVGAELVVDQATADRWAASGIAERAESPELFTSCPRCGVTFPVERTPAADERWVSCPNARCGGFGWYR